MRLRWSGSALALKSASEGTGLTVMVLSWLHLYQSSGFELLTLAGALSFWEPFLAAPFSLTGPPFFAVLETLVTRETLSAGSSSDARLVPTRCVRLELHQEG